MKIWIRSQDKKQLLEAKEVYIREERLLIDENGTRIVYDRYNDKVALKYVIYVNDNHFGIYNTKERALEVIDEIQKALNGTEVVARIGNKDYYETKTYSKDVAIFNMPEE